MNYTKMSVLLFAILAATLGITFLGSSSFVTVTIKSPGITVRAYKVTGSTKSSTPSTTITHDSTVVLAHGTYEFVVDGGDNYESSTTTATINSLQSTHVFDQYYSRKKLNETLNASQTKLQTLAKTQFPSYTFSDARLFQKGDWGVVALSKPDETRYGFIAHNESGVWVAKTEPELILPYRDYTDIPVDVLYSANRFIARVAR